MSQSDRASLWAIRNTRFWDVAGNNERGAEFRRVEGLLAEFAGWPFQILHLSEFPDEVDTVGVLSAELKRALTERLSV